MLFPILYIRLTQAPSFLLFQMAPVLSEEIPIKTELPSFANESKEYRDELKEILKQDEELRRKHVEEVFNDVKGMKNLPKNLSKSLDPELTLQKSGRHSLLVLNFYPSNLLG